MRFEHAAVVDGSADEVFRVTQDYEKRLTWDPFLRSADLLDGATEPRVGVRAWCVAHTGIGMETEYVSFTPPRVAAVKMTRGPRLLESFAGAWEFEPVEGGRTKVTFRYNLRARPRWLAWAIEPMARWWFARETRLRVLALQDHLKAQSAPTATRSSRLTVAAIAVVAFAACDMVHEVAGHGVAAWFVPGVSAISLSSVALQTSGESRLVAAAGSIANVIVGLVAMALFHRKRGLSPSSYFLWLLATTDLLNGTGYPLYSAILGSGDWAVVVAGLEPAVAWRAGLGVIGVVGYAGAVFIAARALARTTRKASDLVMPAYIAGSTLLVLASALNPIGPSLILLSGVSSGFAAMAGLLAVPALVEKRGGGSSEGIPYHPGWIVAGALVGVAFIAVLGPGISL